MSKTKNKDVEKAGSSARSAVSNGSSGVTVLDERPIDVGKGLPPILDFFPTWAQRWGLPDMTKLLAGSEIRVEEFRDGDTLVVRAELPGVDPDRDVDVTVHDGMLTIRAERTERSKTDEAGHFQSEFRYGAFSRTLPLPTGTTADAVVATYRDGILEVRFPVDDTGERVRSIPISR